MVGFFLVSHTKIVEKSRRFKFIADVMNCKDPPVMAEAARMQ
jgi:hypothetical protein